jgi:hypothetical protein
MAEFERRLRDISQLRKVWRAFRDPQERRETERLSACMTADHAQRGADPDPIATYGAVAVRAAFCHWWCTKQYEAIVAWGDRLDSSVLDSEPLLRLYLESARRAVGGAGSPANS